ncbi:MAG: nitroreductase [Cellvibrionales bacterium]|nr:nitroreductase [Cellvibrionales bacterium]
MNTLESFTQVVKSRRSVRGFLSTPIDDETLKNIFTLAQYAPSNCNTQPWAVHVASGNVLESLRESLSTAMANGDYDMDYFYSGTYEGIYKTRQVGAAKALFGAMGIAREDKEGRNDAFFRNFRFFDAPHAAFLFIPEAFAEREACDIGMYAQTLMLSMKAHGVDSCPQTALGFNARIVKEALNVPEGLKLLFGISFGFEDKNIPANAARVDRAVLQECVTFHKD